MRVVIIGGTGHVGTYLVPRLVQAGYEVISISRQKRLPYHTHSAWESVKQVKLDRIADEKNGNFAQQVRELQPDAVIDMLCFTEDSARRLVEALRGRVRHFLHCGTIWVHGHSETVPTTEQQPRRPFGEYGISKAAIETFLLGEAQRSGFPATVLHPGHIVGPGWVPVNPAANFNLEVFSRLARGQEITLPNLGMETVHHVHADDVAQAFMKAMANWSAAMGESFHVVSPAAMTLRGYAEAMRLWFGQAGKIRFMAWEKWGKTVSKDDALATWDHIAHSPNCSIAKAQSLLGYQPRYTSLQAVQQAVEWLIENQKLSV